jgi:HlyD family secretion protein
MRGILTLLGLVVISGAIFSLGRLRREEDDKPLLHVAEEVALTVNVAEPERSPIIRLVQAPGDVESVLEVDVSSEVVAKIEQMPVEEGDFVKEGDLLCRLDDADLVAAIESAEARIAQLKAAIKVVQADIEKAERDCERQMELSERNATNPLEMADYMTIRKKARATLEMRQQELVEAAAQLKRMREDLKRTVIESPIDGVISKLNAKQGEVVVTGTMNNPGTVIMTISDLSKMRVRARVDEVDVPHVQPGQPARVYLQADQDRPVPAEVVRVAAAGTKQVGRDVVTFETLLDVLSDDPRIKPGMTANVEIEVARSEEAITIPVEAVVHRLRKELADSIVEEYDRRQGALTLSERARQAQYIKVVYVMKDEEARIRLIEPGIADTRRVEIVDGIAMGDNVIVGPYRSLDQLKDGRKVALAEEEKKEGAEETEATEGEEQQLAEEGGDTESDDESTNSEDGGRTVASGDTP